MYVISFCLFKRDEINSVSYLAHNKCCKYESALYAQYTCMLCLQLIYMCCCNIIAFRFDLVHAKAFTTCEQQNIHTCYKSKPTKGMNSSTTHHVISYRRTIVLTIAICSLVFKLAHAPVIISAFLDVLLLIILVVLLYFPIIEEENDMRRRGVCSPPPLLWLSPPPLLFLDCGSIMVYVYHECVVSHRT